MGALRLRRIESPSGLVIAATLAREFGDWASAQLKAKHGIEIAAELDHPPEVLDTLLESGRLYVAELDGEAVGVGGLKLHGGKVAEIKRMYVCPSARGRGVGRAIVERLVADARDLGCEAVVLESASFMHAAHALYRNVGFVPADPYAGREFEDFDHDGVVFMRLELT